MDSWHRHNDKKDKAHKIFYILLYRLLYKKVQYLFITLQTHCFSIFQFGVFELSAFTTIEADREHDWNTSQLFFLPRLGIKVHVFRISHLTATKDGSDL